MEPRKCPASETIKNVIQRLEQELQQLEKEYKQRIQEKKDDIHRMHQALDILGEPNIIRPEEQKPSTSEPEATISSSAEAPKEEVKLPKAYVNAAKAAESSSQKKKYYAIFNGANAGIYDDWSKASLFIIGKSQIFHKS